MNNLDEWGEYMGAQDAVERFWSCKLEEEGLISSIYRNNPAVDSVYTSLESDKIDWEVAGRCFGDSTCIKRFFLSLSDSVPDYRNRIQTFCRGLALNKSIECLYLSDEGMGLYPTNDDDFVPVYSNQEYERYTNFAYKYLHPFFANNPNLAYLNVGWHQEDAKFPTSILTALQTSRFLSSVIVSAGGGCQEEFIKAICRKQPGLNHIDIDYFLLSNSSCLEIKNMLCDENCALKSLSLTMVEVNANTSVVLIANGLAKNKSVKCFRFATPQRQTIKSLLSSLQDSPLNVLEKCEFFPDEYRYGYDYRCECIQTSGRLWAGIVKQMPNLTSLNLSNTRFERVVLSSFFSTLLGSTSSLCELFLRDVVSCDETLRELGASLVNNTTLKVLDISVSSRVRSSISSDEWCWFFHSLRTSMLEKIDLSMGTNERGRITSESTGIRPLSNWLASNQSVKILKVSCRGISQGHLLFSTLAASETKVEEVDLCESEGYFAGLLGDFLPFSSQLKRVCLPACSLHDCQVIARALKQMNWSIGELKIVHDGSLSESAAVSHMLANALRTNSTLKVLQLQCITGREWRNGSFNPSAFLSVLCDKSSIDDTYHSNHTLEKISFSSVEWIPIQLRSWTSVERIPMELRSLMYLNRGTNKHDVARKKVIENHTFENVNFVSSSLPNVLSWVGKADVDDGLSKLYGILRRMPHVIRN